MKKITLVIRGILSVFICCLGIYLLWKLEYTSNFFEVDNVVGMMPVAFILITLCGLSYLIWAKHSRKTAYIDVTISLIVALCVVLFPNAVGGNWWINPSTPKGGDNSPDLSVYAPFSDNSQLASLDGTSKVTIDKDFPVLDGALALYPLYSAFAQAVYEESDLSKQAVAFTNTHGAYRSIVTGERDVIFVAGASKSQQQFAQEQGVKLVFTPIGKEAFVFIVGNDNPVDNLTHQQLRNIYSGKTAYWPTLGWNDGGEIVAFQRPEVSGSQSGLVSIVMKNLPIQVPQPIPDSSLIGTKSLMNQVSARWNGVQPVLGYSYKYFATTMYKNESSKLLSINGVYPSIENIQNGTYPFVGDFYAVTNGEPQGNTKVLIDFILSDQGQELITKSGYAPIVN